jgi:hypothetical protein
MTKKYLLLVACAIGGLSYGTLQLVNPSSSANAGGCCVFSQDCTVQGPVCVWNMNICSKLSEGFCQSGQGTN